MSQADHSTAGGHERPMALFPTVSIFGRECPRCQFWKRRTRVQCRKAATRGRRYCRRHRGNIVSLGAANHAMTHGRYSVLLKDQGGAVQRELNHLRDIDVLTFRAEELSERIAAAGATWTQFTDSFGHLRKSMLLADGDGIRTSMNQLQQLADGAAEMEQLWREFDRCVRRRAELVDAERQFQLKSFDVLTRGQARAHAAAVVEAIVRRVKDRTVLSAILDDIRQLVLPARVQ